MSSKIRSYPDDLAIADRGDRVPPFGLWPKESESYKEWALRAWRESRDAEPYGLVQAYRFALRQTPGPNDAGWGTVPGSTWVFLRCWAGHPNAAYSLDPHWHLGIVWHYHSVPNDWAMVAHFLLRVLRPKDWANITFVSKGYLMGATLGQARSLFPPGPPDWPDYEA